MKRWVTLLVAATVACGLSLLGVVAPASAATLIVTSSADAGAGSLRATIAASAAGDTITFAPAVTSIALASQIDLDWGLSIVGPGSGSLTISPTVTGFPLLVLAPEVANQDLQVSGLTIDGLGFTTIGVIVQGGGFAPRDITLSGVVIRNAISPVGGAALDARDGIGNIVIEDSTIENNDGGATPGGAIRIVNYDGDVDIRDSVVANNGTDDLGGAVFVFNSPSGTVTVQSTEFTDNQGAGGGAIWVRLIDAIVVSDSSTFERNSATVASGGAIGVDESGDAYIAESSFIQNSSDAANGGALFFADSTDSLTVTDSAFSLNSAALAGGAISAQNLLADSSISGSSFVSNAASDGSGGAVEIQRAGGRFDVAFSTFTDNSAADVGSVAFGGGLFIGEQNGPVSIDSSTFAGNSLSAYPSHGLSVAIDQQLSSLEILNSTFVESGASPWFAVYAEGQFAAVGTSVSNSTVIGPGGVHLPANQGPATITSSILAGGSHPAVSVDFGFAPVSVDWSLLSSPLVPAAVNDLGNNRFNVSDMKLGPLQNNGGATKTRLPLPSSPAFNAGDPGFVSPPTFDQRGGGYPRVALGRIDIGAVEGALVLAATGATVNLWVPIGGALLVFAGIGAVVVGQVRRARR